MRVGRKGHVLALSVLLAHALSSSAWAEPPKPAPARGGAARAAPKKARRARKEPKRATSTGEAHAPATRREGGPAGQDDKGLNDAQRLARDAAQGANAQIVKEGDTSVKVMEFTGLDIEGRLKSPQLLYFVSRVHAEFDRPKLPHRSFMPELERSTAREPIR